MSNWDYEVIKHCIQPATESDLGVTQPPLIDYVSIHTYTASENHNENVFAPLLAEKAIEATSAMVDVACVENKVPAGQARPTICFDEWNVWDPKRAVGSRGAEERYTLSDALAVAVWLNVFVRQSEKVGMANIAQSVNVISPLMTTKDGVTRQTSWWVYELFCRFVKGKRVQFVVDCDEYSGPTKPAWLQDSQGTRMRWLEVSASVDEEAGFCNLCVANLSEDQDFKTSLAGISRGAEVEVYTVNGQNVQDNNMDGEEKVKLEESKWTAEESFNFRKHSFVLLRWKL